MGYICGNRIRALIICFAMSIAINSMLLMHLKLDTFWFAPPNVKVKKMFDDVYHSEEVFYINYGEMEKKLKIFIYKQGKRCARYEGDAKYSSEGYFFKNIRETKFFTDDPDEALLFFIPISLQMLTHKESSYDKRVGKKAEKCMKNLILEYPYWNRTMGTDHFFLTCVDHDVHIPRLVKNTIRIVCSSTYDSNDCQFIPHKDIPFPSVMQPFYKPSQGSGIHKRRILGFWDGVCNSDTKKKMVNLWGADEVLNIHNTTVDVQKRMQSMYNAKFCICPVGSRITNSLVTLAIYHGCVPVIMEDYLQLSFNDILDWRKFSVVLKESDVYRLKGILYTKEYYDYRRMYSNLILVKRHFEWNTPPVKYDVFHLVMYDLWSRSHIVKYS